MTTTKRLPMIGVALAALLALFAIAGCSSGNTGNANPDSAADGNGSAAQDEGSSSDQADSGTVDQSTVIKVKDGWVAYSGGDMLVLLDSSQATAYQWTAQIEGSSVLKDAEADLPSSTFYDQKESDVVGSAGMHMVEFMADSQNNGESTITLSLADPSDGSNPTSTIMVRATVQNGAFTTVDVQEW